MHLLYFILCSCTEIIFIHFEYIYLLKETDFACVHKWKSILFKIIGYLGNKLNL